MALTLVGVALAGPPAGGQVVDPPFDHADSSTVDVQGTPAMVDVDGSGTAYGPDPRLWEVELTTPSVFVSGTNPPTIDPVQIPLKVRIYLPADYDHDRQAGYPTLYLLHGGGGTHHDWSRPDELANDSCTMLPPMSTGGGDIAATLAGTSFSGIAVMVEGGCAGWYADWYGETDGQFSPKWETFHTQQLIPWIDANLNTDATRSGRAIAGLSMGGQGALRYAARHSDLFFAAGSLSGAVDLRYEPFQDTLSNSMWLFGATVHTQGLLQTEYRVTTGEPNPEDEETSRLEIVYGPSTPPVPPETRPGWPALNPVELAAAGAFDGYATKLAIYAGDDEPDIVAMNDSLDAALDDSGVDHRYCLTDGGHDWSNWRTSLVNFLDYAYDQSPGACP